MHEELMEKENHAFFYFNVGIFILSVKENSFVTMWKLRLLSKSWTSTERDEVMTLKSCSLSPSLSLSPFFLCLLV